MSWPWEFRPETTDGGGALTRADRRRMALKYVAVLAAFVTGALIVASGRPARGFLFGFALAIGLPAAIDLAWLARSDYQHVILKNRRQALIFAAVQLDLALVLIVALVIGG